MRIQKMKKKYVRDDDILKMKAKRLFRICTVLARLNFCSVFNYFTASKLKINKKFKPFYYLVYLIYVIAIEFKFSVKKIYSNTLDQIIKRIKTKTKEFLIVEVWQKINYFINTAWSGYYIQFIPSIYSECFITNFYVNDFVLWNNLELIIRNKFQML